MTKKRVIVACGGAIATSTIAAERIRDLLRENNIDADVSQAQISGLDAVADGADLIVTTAKVRKEYAAPVIHGIAFVSGVNIEQTEQKILDALRD